MLLAQGAEARIRLEKGNIIKERFSKAYRYTHLDESLRQFRTRREAKILQRLEELNFPAPKLQEFSDQRMSITMDFIEGNLVNDALDQENGGAVANAIGKNLGKLHAENIIHGDLTTSNMILNKNDLHFIDFGLSQFSEKVEDKAVDLFLLERALHSAPGQHPLLFENVLKGYREAYSDAAEVLERFAAVKKRGRNKRKE